MKNCIQNGWSALMNWGNRAAKKTMAFGLEADVINPWNQSDLRDAVLAGPALLAVTFALLSDVSAYGTK